MALWQSWRACCRCGGQGHQSALPRPTSTWNQGNLKAPVGRARAVGACVCPHLSSASTTGGREDKELGHPYLISALWKAEDPSVIDRDVEINSSILAISRKRQSHQSLQSPGVSASPQVCWKCRIPGHSPVLWNQNLYFNMLSKWFLHTQNLRRTSTERINILMTSE